MSARAGHSARCMWKDGLGDLSAGKLMCEGVQVFKDFYLSKHSGRRLVWQNLLGHCIVRANFRKGAHELAVSLHQVGDLSNCQSRQALVAERMSAAWNFLYTCAGMGPALRLWSLQAWAPMLVPALPATQEACHGRNIA